jgi:hypothetical protein
MLGPDVVLHADGGGKAQAIGVPLPGRESVARCLMWRDCRRTNYRNADTPQMPERARRLGPPSMMSLPALWPAAALTKSRSARGTDRNDSGGRSEPLEHWAAPS